MNRAKPNGFQKPNQRFVYFKIFVPPVLKARWAPRCPQAHAGTLGQEITERNQREATKVISSSEIRQNFDCLSRNTAQAV
jgi:hypothetical protein